MSARSYTFTHAITRAPGASVTQGLREADNGAPDLGRFQAHHAAYVAALRAAGAEMTKLPALDEFPDGVFVEDTALTLPEGAVILRPGAPSRRGEAAAMAPVLAGFYGEVAAIQGPGFIEGGDILTTGREILVGRSARTDATGIAELTRLVAAWGYRVRELQTPPGVLHFKTDCSLLDEETILATPAPRRVGLLRWLPGDPDRRGRGRRRQLDPLQRRGAGPRRLPPHGRGAVRGGLRCARDSQLGGGQTRRRHVLPVAPLHAAGLSRPQLRSSACSRR